MNTIVRIKFGSHLYGTNTPQSDLDFISVHIPSAKEILLQQVKNSTPQPKKKEGEKNTSSDVDDKSYSIQRFLELLAKGETGPIDMLFAPPESIEISSPTWEFLIKNRQRFLTKKSVAFVGYCRQQANKYGIKGSRVAAAKKVSEFFKQAVQTYGAMSKVGSLDHVLTSLEDEHTKIVQQICNKAGDIGTYLECCNRKVDFNATFKQAYEMFNLIHEKYGIRARQAESNEGIDWKALSHAVRVGYEAKELLLTKHITLPLPNAQHVLDIKLGKLPYSEVSEEVERLLSEVEEASEKSDLPEEPDYKLMDDIVLVLHLQAIRKSHLFFTTRNANLHG